MSHSQEDICFQLQQQIDSSILKCLSEKISKSSKVESDGEDESENNGEKNENLRTSTEYNTNNKSNKENAVSKLNSYSGTAEKLISVLRKSIDLYPGIAEIINKELGD